MFFTFAHGFVCSFQEGPEAISVAHLRTRTTSAIESYNGRIGRKIAANSKFFKFAALLIREEAVSLIEFRHMLDSGGLSRERQHQKTRAIADRHTVIDDASVLLAIGACTYMDFLGRVAFSPANREFTTTFDNISDVTDADLLPADAVAPVVDDAPLILGSELLTRLVRRHPARRGRGTSHVDAPASAIGVAGTNQSTVRGRGRGGRGAIRVDAQTSQIGVAGTSASFLSAGPTASPADLNMTAGTFDDFSSSSSAINSTMDPSDVTFINITLPAPQNLPAHTTRSADLGMCIICVDQECKVRFEPCAHVCYCISCYGRHNDMAMEVYQSRLNELPVGHPDPLLVVKCPICNMQITDTSVVRLV